MSNVPPTKIDNYKGGMVVLKVVLKVLGLVPRRGAAPPSQQSGYVPSFSTRVIDGG